MIFRRVFPSMRGIIERSREIYNAQGDTRDKDSYNESLHLWRLLSGKIVELASLQHEKNKEDYRGRPHDLYCWDEVTEFTEAQYRFVNAWNRTTRPGQRCRIVATGNPPTTAAGQWVVRHWAAWLDKKHPNPALPGELRWYAMLDGVEVECSSEPFEHKGERVFPRSRTFIPAKLEDNPYHGDDYRAMLQSLPSPLREQMLYGDFDATIEDDPWQIVPTQWVLDAQERWRLAEQPERMTAMGVDVARGGADASTICKLYGWYVAPLVESRGEETNTGRKVADMVLREWDRQARIGIDVIGLGASPYDALQEDGVPVEGINFGAGTSEYGTPTDRSGQFQFANVRALGYWRIREALDPAGDIRLALPEDQTLLAHLTAPRWTPTPRGIKVESKDEVKKRLGESPDRGDALAIAMVAIEPKPESGITWIETPWG